MTTQNTSDTYNGAHIPFELLKKYAKKQITSTEKEDLEVHLRQCNHCAQMVSDIEFYLDKHTKTSETLDAFIQKSSKRQFDTILKRHKFRRTYARPLQAAVVVLLLAPLLWVLQKYSDITKDINTETIAIQTDTAGRDAARYQPMNTNSEPLFAQDNDGEQNKEVAENKVQKANNKQKTNNKPATEQFIAANFEENPNWGNTIHANVRSTNLAGLVISPKTDELIIDSLILVLSESVLLDQEGLVAVVYDNKGTELFEFNPSEAISLKSKKMAAGLYYWIIENEIATVIHQSKFFYGMKPDIKTHR